MRRSFIFIFLFIFLAGCAHHGYEKTAYREANVAYSNWSIQGRDAFLDMAFDQWGKNRLLLVGELHGTNEISQIVQALIYEATKETNPVILGLEIPLSEQAAIEAFLASSGTTEDIDRLLSGEFWKTPHTYQDGRRSVAMVSLLEFVRRAKADGGDIGVYCLDGGPTNIRQENIAKNIERLYGSSKSKIIVLIGSFHVLNQKQRESHEKEVIDYLLGAKPWIVSVTSRFGSYWACIANRCKVHAARGGLNRSSDNATVITTILDGRTLFMKLTLPIVSASYPAVMQMSSE